MPAINHVSICSRRDAQNTQLSKRGHGLLPELGLVTSRFWFVPRYMFRRAPRSDTRDTSAHNLGAMGASRFTSCGPML